MDAAPETLEADSAIGSVDTRPAASPTQRREVEPLPERSDTILDHQVTDSPLTLSHESVIEGEVAEELWEMYRRNFAPLEELAILQHCYPRDEILAEFADPAITKIVVWEGTTPVGLGMITNQLEAVPQISPRYLRAKYPDHAADDRIYFGILVAVDPDHRGLTSFNRIYLDMWQMVGKRDGMLIWDVSQFNREVLGADAYAQRVSSQYPRSHVEVIDQQTYFAASIPQALPGG